MKLLLAIEPTDTSGVVARQVAARPWPDGTVARVLTVIEYAAVPSEAARRHLTTEERRR